MVTWSPGPAPVRESRKGAPAKFLARAPRPADRLDVPHPHLEMRVLRRPGQHREGDPEIVVLPRRALIDGAGVAIFEFQVCELLISAADIRGAGKAHKVGLEFTMELLEQDASPD